MRRGGPNKKQSLDELAAEIRAELRGIVRLFRGLRSPISEFEAVDTPDQKGKFYVRFDSQPRIPFNGLQLAGLSCLRLPDERIQDTMLELAKAVWHLKDRLNRYARASQMQVDVEALVAGSRALKIYADLANDKKHGHRSGRSGLSPHLSTVSFDTSRNGAVELYYDGATKTKELIVSVPYAIPFSAQVLSRHEEVIGDAIDLLGQAFDDWLPAIHSLGVLSGTDNETVALRGILSKRSGHSTSVCPGGTSGSTLTEQAVRET